MHMIVNIDVPELTPAIKFYSEALGLRLNRIIDGDVAEMSGASTLIYLLANDTGSTPTKSVSTTRNYTRHWTPVHIDFVVEDIVQSSNQALAAGAKCESECVDWKGSKCITFSDPFGHGFCLIEFAMNTYQEN